MEWFGGKPISGNLQITITQCVCIQCAAWRQPKRATGPFCCLDRGYFCWCTPNMDLLWCWVDSDYQHIFQWVDFSWEILTGNQPDFPMKIMEFSGDFSLKLINLIFQKTDHNWPNWLHLTLHFAPSCSKIFLSCSTCSSLEQSKVCGIDLLVINLRSSNKFCHHMNGGVNSIILVVIKLLMINVT